MWQMTVDILGSQLTYIADGVFIKPGFILAMNRRIVSDTCRLSCLINRGQMRYIIEKSIDIIEIGQVRVGLSHEGFHIIPFRTVHDLLFSFE